MASVTIASSAHGTEKVLSPHPLETVFYPKSVAVLGVTPTPDTVPYDIFHNILTSGYRGTVYPVAPGKRSICAVRAYRYVLDIEEDVDQAVIVFPANVVDRALEQCGKKGVKSVIVISAGFREVGPQGVEHENRLKDICREHGIAMIGPNCLGVINTDPEIQLNASFARKMPGAGRIAFLSQSGALCTAVLDYAREKQIGFSKFVSFGNKAGVTEIELPMEEDELAQGEAFGKLYADDSRVPIRLWSPISGDVKQTNADAVENPSVLARDPYGEGWLIKMTPERFEEGTKELLPGG